MELTEQADKVPPIGPVQILLAASKGEDPNFPAHDGMSTIGRVTF